MFLYYIKTVFPRILGAYKVKKRPKSGIFFLLEIGQAGMLITKTKIFYDKMHGKQAYPKLSFCVWESRKIYILILSSCLKSQPILSYTVNL